jgi:hypothetical protein
LETHRMLTRDATCEICGQEDESTFHAVVRCTKPGYGSGAVE